VSGAAVVSGRLWSLWELMIKFNAAKLVAVTNWLANLAQKIEDGKWIGFPLRTHEELKTEAAFICDTARELSLGASLVSASNLINVLERATLLPDGNVQFSVPDSGLIKHFSGEIVTRVRDELQTKLVLQVPSRYAELYRQDDPPFGEDVAIRFSSISYDIQEAAKCLAMERSTAAAFHAVRCLEAGILAISRCLGIPDPIRAADRNWGSMLRLVKGEIDRRWPTNTNRQTGDGLAFDELYGALAGMQNPYRNATMHLDKVYTQEDAYHIFEVVRGLMRRVASRCDQDGKPQCP
jgi:hypothetical protein